MKLIPSLPLAMFLVIAAANAGMVKGFLFNDDDPYLVESTTGYLHKVEWISGSSLFSRGDFRDSHDRLRIGSNDLFGERSSSRSVGRRHRVITFFAFTFDRPSLPSYFPGRYGPRG
jgi:hypothetical protein